MDAPRTKEALRLRHETEAAKLEDSHGDGNTPFAGPVGEKYPHGFQEMRAKMRVEKRLKKQKKAAEGGLRRGNVLEDDEIDKDDPDANGHESDSSGEEDVSQAHSSPTGSPTARPGAAGGQGQRKKKAEIGCCGRCHRRLIRPTPQTDALFGFGPVSTALVPFVDRLSAKDEQFLFAQLLKCRTDGTVYITFATREMRELVLSKLDADFLPFRGKHYVSLSPVDADPENVNWRLEFRAQRLVVAVGSMIVLLFVYVLLSIPNAYLNIVYARTPGQELHFITDWLTGLGSAIGAMHIVRVGGAVFTWVGFTNRETRNVFFFVATYFSVIGMLIIDIGIIWLITLGKVFDAVNENSKFDLHSLLAVEAQDFLLPFVFSVLFFDLILDVLLPAYVGRNVVRSRMYERISAEKLVSPNAFDYPAQYVTILLTFFAFVVWCWLDVEAVAYLLVGLVVVLCIMYLLTVYSSVRLYKRTSITSPSACRTAFRLWGVGLGQILWNAATYAERRGYVDLNDSGIALIAAHFGLYFLALYMIDSWNEPRAGGTEGEPVSYEEMMLRRAHTGDSATYFNCNHIACLRSKYLRDNPLLADPNGLFKIHDLQHRKDLTQDEKKEEAQRHLDYLWFGRREAGCPGVITPYVAGYDHLQPGMPRLYSSTPIERGDMLERETFAEDEKFLRDEELILEAAVPQSVVDAVTAARRAP
ncbi:unnamed protein product [Amoebophrya sp. A25]|nr:unnamed protein product [Amoebophrya sp. A25]|eukprot:GSA25T00023517001.1